MNEKLKKIVAIIGLAAMAVFSVTIIMFLVNSSLLWGRVGWVAALSFMVGLVMFLWIYLAKGFPAQQQKELERQKLKEEYEQKMAEQAEKDAQEKALKAEELNKAAVDTDKTEHAKSDLNTDKTEHAESTPK